MDDMDVEVTKLIWVIIKSISLLSISCEQKSLELSNLNLINVACKYRKKDRPQKDPELE